MNHKTNITAIGNSSPYVNEFPFAGSDLPGTISWTRVSAGIYRAEHALFKEGKFFPMGMLNPLGVGDEVLLTLSIPGIGDPECFYVIARDVNGTPCDEFEARLDITVIL